MSYAIFWTVVLAASLLWVAAFEAILGRSRQPWLRGALVFLVLAAPLVPLSAFVFATAMMKFVSKVEPNWFAYAISLLLAYILGAVLVTRIGARHPLGQPPAAARWRRVPLALVWLSSVMLSFTVLHHVDQEIRERCAFESAKVNFVYLAALPALASESQNAAPLYEKAFAALRTDHEEEKAVHNPPTGDHDEFDPNEPATIAFLAREASTIALLRQAAALPACRFADDFGGSLDLNRVMRNLNAERNVANVLNLQAREAAAHGDGSTAIGDAIAILRMGRQFGERPTIVAGLVAFGIDALGDATLETALPAVTSSSDLAELRLDELPSIPKTFQQALRGEERWGLMLFYDAGPGNIDTPQTDGMPLQVGFYPSGPGGAFVRAFFLNSDAYIRLLNDCQDLIVRPYREARGQLSKSYEGGRAKDLMVSIVYPAIAQVFETCAIGDAEDRCCRAAVAMTRFRLDHGTLPSHLADLVPGYLKAVPMDPFDGNPLRLTVQGDTWIIYSIGPDGIDNGGAQMNRHKGDVAFKLKLLPTALTTRP